MKKVYVLLFIAFVSINHLFAQVTHNVSVYNNLFGSSSISNVHIGDIIRFVWEEGPHTTTSTSVPSGAATWNAQLNSSSTIFSYTITHTGTYEYKCNFHSGMTGSFEVVPVVMPVKLTSFDVSENKNGAKITWKTASEQNTAYFSLRRSDNNTDFKEISRIPAAGDSDTEKAYSYDDLDLNTTDEFFYYVLVTVDKDASEQYSEIKSLKNKLVASAKLITSISPNPFSKGDRFTFNYSARMAGNMNVKFHNANGQLVYEDTVRTSAGINSSNLALQNLAAGIYTATFTSGNVQEVYKIQVN